MAANDKNVALADAAWKQVFEAGPYTAVIMLDYLRVQANMANWGDVLKSKYSKNKGFEALRPVMAKKDVMAQDAKSLTQIWDSQPGRCTSFAVKVTSMLETKAPNTFKFNIYDIGRHRVARCEKTGILIDSSAVQGAFELPEGNWIRMEGSEASWKWSKGKSKFERNVDSSGIVSSFPHFFLMLALLFSFFSVLFAFISQTSPVNFLKSRRCTFELGLTFL